MAKSLQILRQRTRFHFSVSVVAAFLSFTIGGGHVQAKDQPVVGRKAAARYFSSDKQEVKEVSDPVDVEPSSSSGAMGDDMLFLSLGAFINSQSYEWGGSKKEEDVGRLSYGVTYIFGEWSKFDVSFRMDFNEYRLLNERAVKLSLLPVLTFPQAHRGFPLYFGIGGGLGIFFQQLNRESNVSLDYQLLAGARFNDIFENMGFFVELAMKNHLHLTSVGQFNGTALTAGAVFSF